MIDEPSAETALRTSSILGDIFEKKESVEIGQTRVRSERAEK